MKIFTKCISICAIFLFLQNHSFGQKGYFTTLQESDVKGVAFNKAISKKQIINLNEDAMRIYLVNAPMEFKNNGRYLPLEVPLPDGTSEIFNIVESPILSPEIAAQNPEVKTYTGNGTRIKKAIIRFSLTSNGFNAIILNVGKETVYFEKYARNLDGVYFSYFTKNAKMPEGYSLPRCGVTELKGTKIAGGDQLETRNNSGATLRRFRIAMPADAEYTASVGGAANALTEIMNYVNRMSAVFRNELCVDFQLVTGANMIYTDAMTDPYDNSNQTLMMDQNQTNCDLVVGTANYDIGHVWGFVGFSGGGIASLAAVCDANIKGRGTSGIGAAPWTQVFFDQLLFHEVGHQFGMNHSYNSVIPVCTTRNPDTSVEPGSGASIMSYGFTCDDDDYYNSTTDGPILIYHTASYFEAEEYINDPSPGYGNCFDPIATGNLPPVVTMPSTFTIPKSTPFSLTGSATDANGDMLTYAWEGTNNSPDEPDVNTLLDPSKPPFFRIYEPQDAPVRTYPLLSAILEGTNTAKGDKLPSVAFTTTHNLTVRDNHASGGGTSFGSVTVNVDGAIGPFLETTNLAGTYPGQSAQTITWSVNGTAAATPNVRILASLDGGLTFPKVLIASTPNDGSQLVNLPYTATTQARIKVEAIGNIFFDISNSNFTITTPLPVELISFEAKLVKGNAAELSWRSASELDYKGYEVEMADSRLDFSKIAFVQAKGNTSSVSDYKQVVRNLPIGATYFRLKLLDNNGSFKYSDVRSVLVDENNGRAIKIYPIPAGDQINIELPSEYSDATIEIYNVLGERQKVASTNGVNRSANISKLNSGFYIVKIFMNSELVYTEKVMKY